MHSSLVGTPRTLYALTSEQFDHLIRFLLDDEVPGSPNQAEPALSHPLPIEATQENRYRWDPWDAMARFHVFRDRHERRVTERKPLSGCVERASEWPERRDMLLADHYEWERQRGVHVDQEVIDRLRSSMKKITPSSPLWPSSHKSCADQTRERAENVAIPPRPLGSPTGKTFAEELMDCVEGIPTLESPVYPD